MRIETIDCRPGESLATALEDFESQFRYPLGTGSWFRISHGDDYTRFFRAIGDARCFVALRDDKVLGVITSTIGRVRCPDGQFQRAAYLSDLKVAGSAGGRTLLLLMRAATEWTLAEPTPAFSVVMDGTAREPTAYTGRLGIPAFRLLDQITVLRIPTDSLKATSAEVQTTTIEQVKQRYQVLAANSFATDGGDPAMRSVMEPIGLLTDDGNACGILEDTRQAKLLFRDDGTEMISAHLSCFGYRSIMDAAELIGACGNHCRRLGIPALLVAIECGDTDAILSKLQVESVTKAPASVFGYAFPEGRWSINTAEI